MSVSTSSEIGHNVIEVIDSASNTVIDTITVGFNPEHLRCNPANMSQIKDQILNSVSQGRSIVALDGQLDIYGEISLSKNPSSNKTIYSPLDNEVSPARIRH